MPGAGSTLVSVNTLAGRYKNAWTLAADPNADPSAVDAAWDDFYEMLRFFEEEHGKVVASHFSGRFPAAVLHTRAESTEPSAARGEEKLHLSFPPKTTAAPWIPELLLDCYGLHIEVRQVLHPPSSQVLLEMIFIAMAQLLRLMESQDEGAGSPGRASSPTNERDATARSYQSQVAQARQFFARSAQRVAQTYYFIGMLGGGLVVALLGFLLVRYQTVLGVPSGDVGFFFNCLVIGGVGGIVSVMQRMTSGSLELRYRAGRPTLVLLGMFRPLIGAVFAVVVFVLLMAGLLPIAMPKEEVGRLFYFFFAVAFFAGFSERWVQDMLAAGQRGIAVNGSAASPSVEPAPAR